MSSTSSQPLESPITFIKRCFHARKILWTYHVNMRLGQRSISRAQIFQAIDTFDIIEEYPNDKYFPSYLIRAEVGQIVFHTHVAIDTEGDNVRIITAYFPDRVGWNEDFKVRR